MTTGIAAAAVPAEVACSVQMLSPLERCWWLLDFPVKGSDMGTGWRGEEELCLTTLCLSRPSCRPFDEVQTQLGTCNSGKHTETWQKGLDHQGQAGRALTLGTVELPNKEILKSR